MRFPWRKRAVATTMNPASIEQIQARPGPFDPEPKPREIVCKFCGPVTVTDPMAHLETAEHRLNQATALPRNQ